MKITITIKSRFSHDDPYPSCVWDIRDKRGNLLGNIVYIVCVDTGRYYLHLYSPEKHVYKLFKFYKTYEEAEKDAIAFFF